MWICFRSISICRVAICLQILSFTFCSLTVMLTSLTHSWIGSVFYFSAFLGFLEVWGFLLTQNRFGCLIQRNFNLHIYTWASATFSFGKRRGKCFEPLWSIQSSWGGYVNWGISVGWLSCFFMIPMMWCWCEMCVYSFTLREWCLGHDL